MLVLVAEEVKESEYDSFMNIVVDEDDRRMLFKGILDEVLRQGSDMNKSAKNMHSLLARALYMNPDFQSLLFEHATDVSYQGILIQIVNLMYGTYSYTILLMYLLWPWSADGNIRFPVLKICLI